VLKLKILSLIAALLAPGAVLGGSVDCPPLPGPPPEPLPIVGTPGWWELLAEPLGIAVWHGRLDDAPLGVGHLQLVDTPEVRYHDWPRGLRLPLWAQPGGPFLGWLAGARLHPFDGTPTRPLTGAGMVETGYEHLTMVVMVTVGDWLQLRIAPGPEGLAWTHACHLELGTTRLRYEPWEAFIVAHGDWLHFRNRVPHALRTAPDPVASRRAWIGQDHELKLLELAGDWMRVQVRQPAWTCVGPDRPFPGRIDEGWVRWRDTLTGPWTWIYSRGC
jgi:hypothetical protein